MSYETGKAVARRLHDVRFATRYFVGHGIDIGSGTDPLSNYGTLFPLIRSIRLWDMPQGDAQYMAGVEDKTFDFVHSSHCLEHVVDVGVALTNWIRITKPGGYLIIVVPDEGLYEQYNWPSRHNPDHKHSFNISDPMSKMPRGITLLEDLYAWCNLVKVLKIELLDAGYSYGLPPMDQSALTVCEPAIEFILRRRLDDATGAVKDVRNRAGCRAAGAPPHADALTDRGWLQRARAPADPPAAAARIRQTHHADRRADHTFRRGQRAGSRTDKDR